MEKKLDMIKNLKLNDGEIICPQCNGTGEPNNNMIKAHEIRYDLVPLHCDKCYGNGKLNWVENIVGKKHKRSLYIRKKE